MGQTLTLIAATLLHFLPAGDPPLTRAEESGFTETSSYMSVLEFLHVLEKESPLVSVSFFGATAEGRPLPLAVLGDPCPESPAAVDRTKKTVVCIQGNIHAGEVEGKEACLMLAREMACGKLRGLLNETVVIVVPIFNADGNERLSTRNRPWQAGPEKGVGTRSNAQNLDLNRDFMKVESPEVQALFQGVLLPWNPDLFVDCHTTNGSLHSEPITWSPPTNPLADPAVFDFNRETMLPWIAARTEQRDGYLSIPYGNFIDRRNPGKGWRTFGHEPRYASNYWGLRNRFSVLIEMYVYAEYEVRVRACFSFLQSIVEFCAAHGPEMRERIRLADAAATKGPRPSFHHRFELKAFPDPILIRGYVPRPGRHDPKNPGEKAEHLVPYHGDFRPTGEGRALPEKGYIFPRGHTNVREKLLQHGIRVLELQDDVTTSFEIFEIEKIVFSKHLFQGHITHSFEGKWVKKEKTAEAGSCFVPVEQPLSMLAACLLEPESGDGLAFWNYMDRYITRGTFDPRPAPFPVLRW